MGLTKAEKESNTLSGSVISVVWLFVFLYSTLHSLRVKNNWKCDSQELFKRSLSSILCFIIPGKGSSWIGYDTEIYCVAIEYGNLIRLSFLSSLM